MFCRNCRKYLEQGLQPPRAAAHLDRCASCRAWRDRLATLEAQLQSQPAGTLPEAQIQRLQQRILDRLPDGPSPQAGDGDRTRCKPAAAFDGFYAVAAALLLAGLVGLSWHLLRPAVSDVDPVGDYAAGSTRVQSQVSAALLTPEASMQSEISKLRRTAADGVRFLRRCVPARPVEAPGNATDRPAETPLH